MYKLKVKQVGLHSIHYMNDLINMLHNTSTILTHEKYTNILLNHQIILPFQEILLVDMLMFTQFKQYILFRIPSSYIKK